MKKLFSLIMGIIMVTCLCTSCGKKEEVKPYVVGTISDGVYKNESLNIKYTTPENMRVGNDEELKNMQETMTKSMNNQIAVSECNGEFFALQEGASPIILQIVSYKFKQDIPEDEMTKGLSSNPDTNQTYKLGDTEFHKVSLSPGNNLKMITLFKKVSDHYVTIIAMADDEEKANKVLLNFSKLHD